MEQLDTRLQRYGLLWGRWLPGERLYRSGGCSVYVLSPADGGEDFPCVVKVLTLLGEGEALARQRAEVQREIAALERLRNCETVVTLYDTAWYPLREAEQAAGWDVLLRMERLTCVAELLREGEVLPVAEVYRLARDIAAALAAAHRLELLHRDVKPANLYRTQDGRYQLGDFGVARRSRCGLLETMTGTPAYMAPEVARGEAYDSRADLYALGLVLYQLLNDGQLPLEHPDLPQAAREEAVRRRWNGTRLPPPVRGDRRIKQVVRRCCDPKPDRRFPTAEAVVRALEPPRRGWTVAALAGWSCALGLAAILCLPRPVSAPVQPSPAVEEPAAISEPADTTAQPPDEETEDGAAVRSYTAVQAVLTWEEARVYCEARGGCLATVANQAELDEITAMLDAQGLEVVWLGANNFSSSHGFQWLTGEAFSFAPWALGEPNDQGGQEHYLMMYKKEGQGWVWNDTTLDGMSKFDPAVCGLVCQWEDRDG